MKRLFVIAALALAACGPTTEVPKESPKETPKEATVAVSATLGALAIEDAVAKPPVEGQTTGAGFFVVRNTGETADRLIAASSPNASSIELHTHREVDGMMRMEKVEGVDVPAGGAAVFAPGGLHLMIFGFAPAGDTLPVTLTFEKGGEVTVPFKIMARSADDGTSHGAHEGHGG